MDAVTCFAPATIGNFGPCYDIMGYALSHIGDFVSARKVEPTSEDVIWEGVQGPRAKDLANVDFHKNSAWAVANALWRQAKENARFDYAIAITLHKYLPIASGIGSSAASAAAAARAVLHLLDLDLPDTEVIQAMELGEEVTSGTGYPDNVVPAFFGGIYLICEGGEEGSFAPDKERYVKLQGGDGMITVVVKPDLAVTTRAARQAVRDYLKSEYLDLKDGGVEPSDLLLLIREQSARAASMVNALYRGDIHRVGQLVDDNPFLENARSHLIPAFERAKEAARQAGALGCSIAGAGPAVFAITEDDGTAARVRDSMVAAFAGHHPRWLISPVNTRGTIAVDSIEKFLAIGRGHHDFFE